MTVRFTTTAARQLAGILTYIEERNPQGALRVMARMQQIFALLGDYPLTGQATSRPGQRRMVLGSYPYAVFYRLRGDEIMIQRIRHTSRRPR